MKKIVLPNGQTLLFPKDTHDSVIKSMVKKIVKETKDQVWDTEQVKTLINEITKSQTEIDAKRSSVDHFGPALVDHTKKVIKSNEDLANSNKEIIKQIQSSVKDLISSHVEKLSSVNTKGIEKELKEISKQIVDFSNKTELIISSNNRNVDAVLKAIMVNNDIVKRLISEFKDQTSAVHELAEAVANPPSRMLIFGKDGKVKGLE